MNTLSDNFLHQCVTFPSFQNANGLCVNFLDLVLTDSNMRVYNVESGPPLSDDSNQFHISINWNIALRTLRPKRSFVRS
jgi:hypothetical protein